ncbi:MAG: peptidylprolyl isomerase [Myxococcales bacterium]|nr:peptidylprolyl isomerase [Myxococcales bacterium]
MAAPVVAEAEPVSEPVVVEDLDLDSQDILARPDVAPSALVDHVLIGWRDLAAAYGGQLDPRAAGRSNAEAAVLAEDIAAKLAADPSSMPLIMQEHSEDPTAFTGDPYEVKADSPFVEPFKNLALRLREHEVGIVKTAFGYHVMMRVPPPPPDPLESAEILQRVAQAGPVHVQHIRIGWIETAKALGDRADARAKPRTKADADKLAKDLLGKARRTADLAKLMKQHSEDPGSSSTGMTYEVGPASQMVEPFKRLALRLKLGEAGLVKSPFGWHVMKRIAPKGDPLESAAILARAPQTADAKVKHILLGWTEVHHEDDRGKVRTRAELEVLVKATVTRLKRGTKIERIMAELSEDPGSAANGMSYDVTPEAGLVEPFKRLGLRLKLREVGVVRTHFGMHILQRVE